MLGTLETYYDTVPRAGATTEEVGPFTLFVRSDPDGWPYYARPRLGYAGPFTAADVDAVRRRQRELGVQEALEWVHDTTPTLLAAARSAGLSVEECPLLVLTGDPATALVDGVDVHLLGPEEDLSVVVGVVHAAFEGTDEVVPRPPGRRPALVAGGLLAIAGAYDAQGGVVGGGSHGPRGTTTELTGIGVLPRARRHGVGAALTRALVDDALATGVRTVFLSAQDDAVARVYERIGFQRVGTACMAES